MQYSIISIVLLLAVNCYSDTTPKIIQFPITQSINTVQPTNYIPVINRFEVHDEAGQFALRYQTGDGQVYTEQGTLKSNLDNSGLVLVKTGSFSYTAPDGTPIEVSYVADENGFRPVGKHLPVAPFDILHSQ